MSNKTLNSRTSAFEGLFLDHPRDPDMKIGGFPRISQSQDPIDRGRFLPGSQAVRISQGRREIEDRTRALLAICGVHDVRRVFEVRVPQSASETLDRDPNRPADSQGRSV